MKGSVSRETLPVAAGADVSRETRERLRLYADLLLRWNARINLVSRADEAHLWSRHIGDSLQLIPLIPASADRAIDLGSGAGFPGLVLAIATGLPFSLIEADARKGAFLREAARVTGAPATIVVSRIEAALIAPATLVTARALAPLPALLELALPKLAPGGVCLFPKGEDAAQELTAASAAWNMHIERHESRISRGGCILRISEVARV